jgi:hypothetical protein
VDGWAGEGGAEEEDGEEETEGQGRGGWGHCGVFKKKGNGGRNTKRRDTSAVREAVWVSKREKEGLLS